MMQKFTLAALSVALTASALAAPTQSVAKKSPVKSLPTKQVGSKTTTEKPVVLLSKITIPDGKTPVANVKNTPVPDVAPVNNGYHVVINIPQQRLFLYKDGVLEKVYPVAVGKAMTQTNLGEHKIGGKAFDPTWNIPKSIQAELKDGRTQVPPGPNNPLGPVFVRMGNPKLGLGIHGTNEPSSVPGVRSHGCVRMKSEQAMDFANTITTGSPATVSYEMATLNVDDANNLWLAVFRDPYNKKNLNASALKNTIQAWAKSNGTTIASTTIDKIIKAKAGKPICLSCQNPNQTTAKGNFQSLAWNSSSTKFTAPKSAARSSTADIPAENNEVEVEAESKPVTKTPVAASKKVVSKSKRANNASNVKAATSDSETERPLKPISATNTSEQPLKPINVKSKNTTTP